MIQILKFNSSNYSKIGFASDFHLFHQREFVWKKRGFNSCEEYTSWIKDNINLNFDENSILFYLGDFALNANDANVLFWLSDVLPQIYYVWGNHESVMKRLYMSALPNSVEEIKSEIYPFNFKNVTFIGNSATIKIDKTYFFLSHFAHDLWDNMNSFVYHLCGHSHGSYSRINLSGTEPILDVGVDNALIYNKNCFFDITEIQEILKNRKFEKKDHHE